MDMHTLHVEHAALLGLFTLLTVVNSLVHRGTRGLRWFPAFTFCAFAGAVLISLRGPVPVAISVVMGDLFFSLAYVFLHRAFTEFFGKRNYQWWFQLALAGMCAAVVWHWTMPAPNTQQRLLWYSVILSVQVGLSAYFVLRNAIGGLRWAAWMMGGSLAKTCAMAAGTASSASITARPSVKDRFRRRPRWSARRVNTVT